jgi:two-component system nitrate/nitrite response regulator NarL
MAGSVRKRITVVVADDHPLYRDGVVRGLAASGQIEIVAEAADGRAALTAIKEHSPDVALLDYKLPGLDGVAITHAVVREQLPTRVLLLSAFTDSGVVYKALETGAAGFISKEARREEIVDGVLAVARGENVVPPEIASGLVSEIRLRKQDGAPALSAREQEILHLIAAGKSLPQIATELHLGLTTVKTHVQHLYEKLGVSDRAAAVASAMRRGLIE